jgi:hypothetical protein
MFSYIKNLFHDSAKNYYFLLIFLAISLPLSVFTTTLAEILLILNWIAEGKFSEKLNILKQRKTPIIVSSIFLLHIIGLLYTNDFQYAFHDLKIKLPILIIPLLIGSSPPLSDRQIRTLLLWFSAAILASTLISSSIFFGIYKYEYYDVRDISLFISHIRFSLMINLAICSLFYYGFGGDTLPLKNKKLRIALVLIAFWLIGFLLILKALTGLIILMILILVIGWKYSSRIPLLAPRFIIRILIISLPLIIASFISHAVAKYFYREKINFSELDTKTPDGNTYYNNTELNWVENGNYVWIYVCERELLQEWNKRSSLDYDGKDKQGQELRFTLIRYLTSKGYRKDAGGVRQMNATDIQAVENGVANYIFLNKYSLYPRIYQVIWELDNYRHGSNPSGHSVALRLEYYNAAFDIIKHNLIIGVGTGDVQKEFNAYYDKSDTHLKEKSRRRAHNQFITLLITFGLLGFIISIFAMFYPIFKEDMWGDYLFLCFAIIGFLSMLNEDTLETQTGVSFFIFFYSLFLFGRNRID